MRACLTAFLLVSVLVFPNPSSAQGVGLCVHAAYCYCSYTRDYRNPNDCSPPRSQAPNYGGPSSSPDRYVSIAATEDGYGLFTAYGSYSSNHEAEFEAERNCNSRYGTGANCRSMGWARNGCLSIAEYIGDWDEIPLVSHWGSSVPQSINNAIDACMENTPLDGCRHRLTSCSNGTVDERFFEQRPRTPLLSSPDGAHAELAHDQRALQSRCQGGNHSDPQTQDACEEAAALYSMLRAEGLCFGHGTQASTEFSWHYCTDGSIRN